MEPQHLYVDNSLDKKEDKEGHTPAEGTECEQTVTWFRTRLKILMCVPGAMEKHCMKVSIFSKPLEP